MKKQITKEEFIKMYHSTTNAEIARQVGCAERTVRLWAQKFGLPSKAKKKLIID